MLVFPVKDVEKAKAFFKRFLGVEPYVDGPYYVGFKADNMEIGLDPNSDVGPIAYVDVIDIKASLEDLVKTGGNVMQDAMDVCGGMMIAKVKDDNGNVVGLRQLPK
ncbi:MAG: Glyoxalase-like domain protein [Methanomassiliicoccales archaeon PtaU1.Bin124]|nr:MAG: Glyoxalase-like domain protein [Methanomassiliicoccales archaeon PtaU1.Bin124]